MFTKKLESPVFAQTFSRKLIRLPHLNIEHSSEDNLKHKILGGKDG
jgi:hypothetical protein